MGQINPNEASYMRYFNAAWADLSISWVEKVLFKLLSELLGLNMYRK